MDVVLIKIMAFLAVLLGVIGIANLINAFRTKGSRKLEQENKPLLFRMFSREAAGLGKSLEPSVRQMFPSSPGKIKRLLNITALHEQLTVRDVLGLQFLMSLTLGVGGGLITFLLTGNNIGWFFIVFSVGSILGWMLPANWLKSTAQKRQDQISKELPYAIDLLTTAMQAGQDFGAALNFLVFASAPGPLTEEFNIVLQESKLSKTRVHALSDMADRLDIKELRSMVAAVAQSIEVGGSVAETMRIQSDEIRNARFHRAERKAARAPSIMMIPMAIFILPAVFIIIITPLGIQMMDALKQ